MRRSTPTKTLLVILFLFSSTTLLAQVKIGGNPKEDPHSSAVLELQSIDKGLLLPRMNQQQMLAIKEPANALVIFNTDAKAIYIYSLEQKQWLPLLQQTSRLGEDSCEWEFDTLTSRVFLVRGYPLGDSVFYTTDTKKFVFSDRTENTNSLGQDFPVTSFTGKYYFKATASRFTDSSNLNPTAFNVIFEVDSSGANTIFRGMQVATVNNPKNTGKLTVLSSLGLSTIHSGQDSVLQVAGMQNSTTVNGTGAVNTMLGFTNSVVIRENATQDVLSMSGIRNSLNNVSPLSKVNGNVFGYFGSAFFSDSVGAPTVNGNIYGVFLSNIQGAAPKRNYAFYSGKGHNRFADSTLITDGFFTSPRAVLDVNATSAMIIPSGNTAQRPVTGITAMFRNNTDLKVPEFFDGTGWQSIATGLNEWKFDPATNRVNLVRGLPLNDTIFYNSLNRRFVFSDRYTNTNSLGQDFGVESFNGKYTFKTTASQRTDTSAQNGPGMMLVYEVDQSADTFFPGVNIATVANPKRISPIDQLLGVSNNTIHSAQDSVQSLLGMQNTASANGNGYTEFIGGLVNSARLNNLSTNSIGTMMGIQNIISRAPTATGRIKQNAYGYFGSTALTANSVDGSVYGVFLNNVIGAGPKKNFAFYSNKGLNRFADSTLITDQFFINPRAVLDINATSAMIIPSGTTLQRPATGITAMFRNNTDLKAPEFFDGVSWQSLSTGASEWKFDGVSKVNLVRGLAVLDTIFYNSVSNQFVFSDRNTNTNSLGQDFPVESFGAKYTFKTTASRRDSTQFNGANTNIVYEVDNTTSSTLYNALSTSAVVNPKAFQKADQVSGITNTTIHAGNDSVFSVVGIINTSRNSGNGRSGQIIGIQNLTRIQNGVSNNTGEMIGFANFLGRSGATAGRVTGNVYGIQQNFSGFANNVDGTMYGIFINTVSGAGPRKNYAYYSNKGLNRLGDSLLVTDGASILPRAVLDINATSAMIVPTGTTAQRPVTGVTGMVRYNTTNQALETFNGSQWNGIIRSAVNIDIPNTPSGSGNTVSVAVTNASTGSAVSVSPSSALPNGIVIAWARVSVVNTVEIRFENNSGAPVNPAAQSFNIRVIRHGSDE